MLNFSAASFLTFCRTLCIQPCYHITKLTEKKGRKKNSSKKDGTGKTETASCAGRHDENALTPGRQVTALLLAASAIFLALALASYSPDDPCLNHFTTGEVKNWMGPAGAHIAGFLRDMLGLSSWLTVLWTGYGAMRVIDIVPPLAAPRTLVITGWVLILASLTVITTLLSKWMHPDFLYRAGGLAGRFLTDFLCSWTGIAGAVLISMVMLLAGIVMSAPFVLSVMAKGFARLAGKTAGTASDAQPGSGLAKSRKAPEIPLPDTEEDAHEEKEAEHVPRINAPAKKKKSRKEGGKDISARPEGAPDSDKENKEDSFAIKPVKGEYKLPPLSFLQDPPDQEIAIDRDAYLENARTLEQKLLDFSVAGKVVEICPGPVVTMYEFSPAPGVKINKVASLSDDLALALKTHSVRIVAPIPGKAVIGIELANTIRQGVWLKEIISSDVFQKNKGKLLLALGNDIVGQPVVTDLTRMPHLLIAGATGTGKSVGLNAMICSLLYRLGPDRLRMLMVDPKRIELSLYDGIPHLIHPVVSEPKEATRALKWAVMEMERRYQLLEEAHARNLEGYNSRAEEKLPYLLVIIDELADLMMVSSKEVEAAIARLAQMARAAGIHLLIATQRPSVDVLTGLIKANFPARLSFKVSSKIDSRTILDVMGAERLLGMGDMLFLPPGSSALERIHGAYVSETEIIRVVEFLKSQGEPDYDLAVTEPVPGEDDGGPGGGGEIDDEKYDQAVEIVTSTGLASISGLQRRMRIGYNRAARMIEQMERDGVVTPTDSMGRRQVIARKYEDD